MVKNCLQWWLEYHNLLPKCQQGFRGGKPCAKNLSILSQMKNTLLLAAFLDVQDAFDNINIGILLMKLASLGYSKTLILFIKFLTHKRYVTVEIPCSSSQTVHKGVSQGGMLSPLLFILYTSNITYNIQKSIVSSLFADDIAVFIKSTTVKKGQQILQNAIQIIWKNLLSIGLELTPNKTKYIHINNKNIRHGTTNKNW